MGARESFEMGREAAGGGQYSGVSQGMDIAFQAFVQNLAEKRKSATATREAAQSAVFENDPAAAYSVLGMEAPPAQEPPAGTRPTKQTVTRGNTATTYEAPEELDLVKALKIYTDAQLKHSEQSSFYQLANPKYKPAPFPKFDEWMKSTGVYDMVSNTLKNRSDGKSKQVEFKVSKEQPVRMKAPDGTIVKVTDPQKYMAALEAGLVLAEE